MAGYNKPSAPYNFVPLNKKVLPAPFTEQAVPELDNESRELKKLSLDERKYIHYLQDPTKKKNSGYFDITILAKTPLMIAKELRKNETREFFALGARKCVPGSSLRGCIKNLYKIISCSGFKSGTNPNSDTKDGRLYFRGFASPFEKLKEHYSELMAEETTSNLKVKAGFLVYKGNGKKRSYFIVPCPDEEGSKKNYRNMREKDMVNWTELTGEKYEDKDIYVYVGLNPSLGDKPNTPGGARWHDNYVDVFTGVAESKKAFYRLRKPKDWRNTISVPAELIESYKNDNSRGKIKLVFDGFRVDRKLMETGYVLGPRDRKTQDCSCYGNLLEKGIVYVKTVTANGKEHFEPIAMPNITVNRPELAAKRDEVLKKFAQDSRDTRVSVRMLNGAYYDNVVPCFYIADKNNRTILSFGANPYYRTPYDKNISEHIPKELLSATNDFTDAIFGNMVKWGSRVYFEDCYLKSDSGSEAPDYPQQMGQPQLTSFQNYLEVDEAGEACHWDEENPDIHIRGYKQYWHKNGDNWQGEKSNMTTSPIRPLKKGAVFQGRIRFENLGDEELGALAKVLCLCDSPGGDICMKLGTGKPLGLGSIKLKATLHLRQGDYYKKLFSTGALAAESTDVSPDTYIKCFDEYMERHFTEQQVALYKERIEELKLIMDFNMKDQVDDWENVTRYVKLPGRKPNAKTPPQEAEKMRKHNAIAERDKELANYRVPLPSIRDIVARSHN